MRALGVVSAVCVVILVQCSVALGSPPTGVHIDPGSPAGKQYAIPISSARSETAGQTGSNVSQNPPAFGVGVTPSASSTSTTTSGARSAAPTTSTGNASKHKDQRQSNHKSGSTQGGSGGGGSPGDGSSPGGMATASVTPSSDSVQASNTGGSGWLALVLGGALVLVLGGAGGFALRRRLS
jgi:cobalamin biosynthesis Mg chelatase CobN